MKSDLTQKVADLQAAEMTDRQIAKALGVHHATVASHRRVRGLKPNGVARRYLDQVDEFHARCTRCKEVRPLTHWPTAQDGRKNPYRLSYCLACRRKQMTVAVNRTPEINLRARWHRLRARCRKHDIVCTISWEEFLAQWRHQKGLCFYTDIPMTIAFGCGAAGNACSVDKIMPDIGYVSGNVVFAANRINSMKHDVTLDEMKLWMPLWYSRVVAMWRANGVPCFQVAPGAF